MDLKARIVSIARKVIVFEAAVVAFCVILLFAGELTCRALDLGKSAYIQPDETVGARLIPGKTVLWNFEGRSQDTISSAGFRDVEHAVDKPPGVRRILLLGDSVSEGMQVPLQSTVARRLQRLFDREGRKVEVINASCSTYSLGQLVVLYNQISKSYKPDEIILLYGFGNSLTSIRDANDLMVRARPYFYMDNDVLSVDTTLLPSRLYCRMMNFLLNNSRLCNFVCHEDFKLLLTNSFYREFKGNLLCCVRTVTCRKMHYPMQFRSQVRDALLSLVNRVARLNGQHLTVVTLPSMKAGWLRKDYDDVKRLGFQQDFSVVDLDQVFDRAGRNAFINYHLSAAGHNLMAQRMYDFLEARGEKVAVRDCTAQTDPSQLPM